jgi:hypothetical protein
MHDLELPAIVRALLPIGEPVMIVPIGSPQRPHVEVPLRETVAKANGSTVSTTFFLQAETAFISDVLFASRPVWALTWEAQSSMGLIHRPDSVVPVARRTIPTKCEMWLENGVLEHRGDCARDGVYSRQVARDMSGA